MKTKQYIKEFNLDSDNPSQKNIQDFHKAFSQEFRDRLDLTREVREKMGLDMPFNIFCALVKEHEGKFASISAHASFHLTRKHWNEIYAKTIIPLRASLYPEEHQKILAKRQAEEEAENINIKISQDHV